MIQVLIEIFLLILMKGQINLTTNILCPTCVRANPQASVDESDTLLLSGNSSRYFHFWCGERWANACYQNEVKLRLL